MGVYVRGVMLGVSLVAFLGACAKVPYTGRIQSNIVPDGIMRTLGKTTYATMLSGQKLQAKEQTQLRLRGSVSAFRRSRTNQNTTGVIL